MAERVDPDPATDFRGEAMKTTTKHLEYDANGQLNRELVYVYGEYAEECVERLLKYDANGQLVAEEVHVYDVSTDELPDPVEAYPTVEADPMPNCELRKLLATDREIDRISAQFGKHIASAFAHSGITVQFDGRGIARLVAAGDAQRKPHHPRSHPRGPEA